MIIPVLFFTKGPGFPTIFTQSLTLIFSIPYTIYLLQSARSTARCIFI